MHRIKVRLGKKDRKKNAFGLLCNAEWVKKTKKTTHVQWDNLCSFKGVSLL